ncbi:hypothetical protein CF327_g6339 [Tilletia walkeri]|uniref:GST N-terminal domain-containing protein n=1 Tax=Tilletia walkeri TaxID=117179 RepID=A0A8X7T2E1_9BASI|nr:hypothetical protein CF327_g6339 [Tilletia walkeri]KAE8265333.1 hypothetical protein A4X09_0g6683 [Tilletia walkeri]
MTSPLILYDILPNVDNPQRPYALLPNPWITRLVLKAKNIPFTVKLITTDDLRAQGKDSFRQRLGDALGPNGRPLIPMIEHNNRLIGDNMTIADYLDVAFPDTPSAYLPELSSSKAHQNDVAHRLAWNQARQTRSTFMEGHAELIYHQATELFDEHQRVWMRSDEKIGMPNAYNLFLSLDRAVLLANVRSHIAGTFSILLPPATLRVQRISSGEDTTKLVNRPSNSPPLFLASPSKPGLIDFTVFSWFLFTYTADRPLNEAIWSESSDKARKWLEQYEGGKFALKGDIAQPNHWPGDLPLQGVSEWVDRMFSLYDNYTRKIINGEILEGEPEKL